MSNEELQKKISSLEEYVYKGDGISLPISLLTAKLENLQKVTNQHSVVLDKLHQERNKITYMFITLLVTVLSKAIIQYLTG